MKSREHQSESPLHGARKHSSSFVATLTAIFVSSGALAACTSETAGHSVSSPTASSAPIPGPKPLPTPTRLPSSSTSPRTTETSLPPSSTSSTKSASRQTPSSPRPSKSTTAPAPGKITLPLGASESYKVAQTFIVGFDANTPLATILQVAKDTHIGGIFLTDTQDAVSKGFTKSYYAELGKAAGVSMLIASDEEGGEVHRLNYGSMYFPSAKAMGGMSTSQVEAIGEQAGARMRADGVTVNLAPVLDIDNHQNNGAISGLDRSFGSDPATIAAKASAFAQGLEASGIIPVLKHFPGIGLATPDSDTDAHRAFSPPLAELQNNDLRPYQTILSSRFAGAVMLSNEYVTGLDTANPASTSPKVVNYLRSMGFSGLITTDALSAIGYDGRTLSNNVLAAEEAGVNAPLFSFTTESELESTIHLVAATIPESQINNSLAKVLDLKNQS